MHSIVVFLEKYLLITINSYKMETSVRKLKTALKIEILPTYCIMVICIWLYVMVIKVDMKSMTVN